MVDITKRSPREDRMADQVRTLRVGAPETPAERNARINRNWEEIKRARNFESNRRNHQGVKILDAELEAGRGIDFPEDATFDESTLGSPAEDDTDLGSELTVAAPAPVAPAAPAQPPLTPMQKQEEAERVWEKARQDYIRKHGVLTKGKTQSQAISDATGLVDPATTRGDAEAQHVQDTGELIYGDSAFYNIAKPAAAIAGFAAEGPLGAVGAEMVVRATALAYNLNAALDKGLDPDQAGEIFVNELAKGVGVDALFNFGAPIIGRLIGKIPGVQRMSGSIMRAIEKRLGAGTPTPELRAERLKKLQEMTTDPNRQKAVSELSKRVPDDTIPTRGQVTGKIGATERATQKAFPTPFEEQEAALRNAAEGMRGDLVAPAGQPSAKQLGERIVAVTEATVKKTKDRLRPVFEAANKANVYSDFKNVVSIAKDALKKDGQVMGKGKLSSAERAHLQAIVDDAANMPQGARQGAEATLDFISTQKALKRTLNPNGEPTEYFGTIVDRMTRAAEHAFELAARQSGHAGIAKQLANAKRDYRIMNESIYGAGAIKQALRKGEDSAEDIGRYLWQNGKVTRIEQLDELLALARGEGVMKTAEVGKLRREITRGFLQKAVKDVESAAKWSKMLADPDRRATWEALTAGPQGKALRNGMAVLEQAAQMAVTRDSGKTTTLLGQPIGRAAGGTLGLSLVTGAVNPYLAGVGISIVGAMKLMSTAFVHGDKGTINLLAKVINSRNVGTAAATKALQAMLPELQSAAEKYDVSDLFLDMDQKPEEAPK